MTTSATFPNDVTIRGMINAGSVNFNEQVKNSDISPTAHLDYDKVEHLHAIQIERQGISTTASTHIAHIVKGAFGSVVAVRVACAVVPSTDSAAACVIDVKKGTTSVLTETITLDNTKTAYLSISGTIVTSGVKDVVAGNILVVTITPTTHTSDCVESPGVTIYVREDGT